MVENNGYQLAYCTMGNAHALEKHQLSNVGSGTSSSVGIKDFESRWRSFMNSLDLSAEHIKQIELLDEGKKAELLSNYESKNPRCSAFHYVTLLKATRIELIWKKKVDGSSFRSLLSSIEISLRTNNVEWVYDFLDLEGLETLVDLMLQCMHFLSGTRHSDHEYYTGVNPQAKLILVVTKCLAMQKFLTSFVIVA